MESENQLYEVEFKALRRHLYDNTFTLELRAGDWVIVEAERGEDMGVIHRILSPKEPPATKPKHILRAAGYEDHSKLDQNREKEKESMTQCQEMIASHGLKMKLIDVEYQFDCNKLTFFFTADQRVDFRSLVKDLANVYRTRIELRQIGVRDEARRIGGFGVCGLKQCCTTFLTEFAPISTQLARDQDLSLNPAKISGNCGRLLCCLQYEHRHYKDTTSQMPRVGSSFTDERGRGEIRSINVFDRSMKVRFEDGETAVVTWEEFLRKRRREERSRLENEVRRSE